MDDPCLHYLDGFEYGDRTAAPTAGDNALFGEQLLLDAVISGFWPSQCLAQPLVPGGTAHAIERADKALDLLFDTCHFNIHRFDRLDWMPILYFAVPSLGVVRICFVPRSLSVGFGPALFPAAPLCRKGYR
ncbi:hypothetical protein [Pseudomonas lopnurensis]|uniref:hypothetical protein n=1 Tax=Pseudomonas lopnurensis TaxID=1477517 RepID=UPI001A9C5910|nr:hypothetical protein [Pseudomonas lopnurensis]